MVKGSIVIYTLIRKALHPLGGERATIKAHWGDRARMNLAPTVRVFPPEGR
jgi:hypothetical protein